MIVQRECHTQTDLKILIKFCRIPEKERENSTWNVIVITQSVLTLVIKTVHHFHCPIKQKWMPQAVILIYL